MAQLRSGREIEAAMGRIDSPPPGMAISMYPPAREHYWDPDWWDMAGRDIIRQRHIFDRYSGVEQQEKIKETLVEFPDKLGRIYEKAAEEGFPDAIESLLALGHRPDRNGRIVGQVEENGDEDEDETFYVLHIAAYEGQVECVKVLVEQAGVEVDALEDRSTPLENAAVNGKAAVVEWLLQHGADPNHVPQKGIGPLFCAVKGGNLAVVKLILEHPSYADIGVDGYNGLIAAAALSANPDILKLIFSKAGFPDIPSPEGVSEAQLEILEAELCRAITASSLESTRLMLSYLTPTNPDGTIQPFKFTDAGYDANAFNATEDSITNTALFDFCWETLFLPFASSLDRLPSYSERLNRRLMSAAGEGALDTALLLLDKYEANVNHISHKFRCTPLLGASARNSIDIMEALLQRGADIHLGNGRCANGPTALHNAIRNNNAKAVHLLLQHGGPVEELRPALYLEELRDGMEMIALALEDFRAPVYIKTRDEHERTKSMYDVLFTTVSFTVGKDVSLQDLRDLEVRREDEQLVISSSVERPLMTRNEVYDGGDGRTWLQRLGLMP